MIKEHEQEQFPFWNPAIEMEDRLDNLMSLLTTEEKTRLLYHIADDIPRLNIKHYYHGNEALHGVCRPGKATVFPQAIAFGATWNPNLISQVAKVISDEARAKHHNEPPSPGHSNGLLTFWSPTVNMARDPRWGRTAETYGEDPWLTSRIGIEFVKGLQGDDPKYLKVVSTPKHYVGNNEDHNRNRCKPNINMLNLREYFLPAFRALIVEGKAQSIMSAYNAIFDIPCSASDFLLIQVLRNEWKFKGYVVTDCSAISNMMPWNHRYVWTWKKAVAAAINAGIDLECGHLYKKGHLMGAINDGLVSEERLDYATRNVLRTYFKLGRFDPDEMVPYSRIPYDVVGSKQHSDIALEVARQSIVLLKNEKIQETNDKKLLPLEKDKLHRIAVVGPNAGVCQFGDYSGTPKVHPISPLQGLIQKLPDSKINYVPWANKNLSKKFHPIPSQNMRPSEDCKKYEGLRRFLYTSPKFQGNEIKGLDYTINFNWEKQEIDANVSNAFKIDDILNTLNQETGSKVENFSIKWSGFICPDIAGTYSMKLETDGFNADQLNKENHSATIIVDGKTYNLSNNPINVVLEKSQAYSINLEFSNIKLPGKISLVWKIPLQSNSKGFEQEINAAKDSDLVIAYLGLGTFYEREGHDKKNLDLPKEQLKMMKEILKVNKNIVVVLISGSPLAINWIDENIPAIVEAWYPGERGGEAIAEILLGEINPSGKLPLTFYKSTKDLLKFNEYDITKGMTYWYFDKDVLYPFGFGLSYTDFEYSDLKLSSKNLSINDKLTLTLNIKNTGDRAGDEIVQVYVRFIEPEENHRTKSRMPLQQLKAFKRIIVNSGETKQVDLVVPIKNLEFYDTEQDKYFIQKGVAEVLVGKSSRKIIFIENIKIR